VQSGDKAAREIGRVALSLNATMAKHGFINAQ
jgi:hypothetical protein